MARDGEIGDTVCLRRETGLERVSFQDNTRRLQFGSAFHWLNTKHEGPEGSFQTSDIASVLPPGGVRYVYDSILAFRMIN